MLRQAEPGTLRDAEISEAAARSLSRHKRHPFVRSAAGGRTLSALMLPLLAIRPPTGYGVITTAGRKTGKLRRRCLRAIQHGDVVYVVMLRPPIVAVERPGTVSAWVLNIRADPKVRVRLAGGSFAGVARELREVGELERARRAFCEPVVPLDYMECNLHLRGVPSRAKIREMHRYWFDTGIPLAVELVSNAGT